MELSISFLNLYQRKKCQTNSHFEQIIYSLTLLACLLSQSFWPKTFLEPSNLEKKKKMRFHPELFI